jgi:Fe-S cluster biogenesis protein NfuA
MSASVSGDALAEALAQVRPLILGHGGDIGIEDVSIDGVVSVRLFGAGKACPNIAMTYVGPIRTTLMSVEEVTEVRCDQVKAEPKALGRKARLLGTHPFEAHAQIGKDAC